MIRRRAACGRAVRYVFDGEICGFGTASGHRVVIGRWSTSPFGSVADVMIEDPDGVRLLVAPRADLARFIADTYEFDAVEIAPVTVAAEGRHLTVDAGALRAQITVGGREWIGLLLRLVPRRVAAAPVWAAAIDPVARLLLAGVRTRGSTRGGRREWYGAHDLHRLSAVHATWHGKILGAMADVVPPVRFGFGSTPRRPTLVRVTTTVEDPAREPNTGSRRGLVSRWRAARATLRRARARVR